MGVTERRSKVRKANRFRQMPAILIAARPQSGRAESGLSSSGEARRESVSFPDIWLRQVPMEASDGRPTST